MAAPPVTARIEPSGDAFLNPDGFSCLVAFQNKASLWIWENAAGGVTPPEIDGGEKIPITTMFNKHVRTFRARRLRTYGDAAFKCFYDPDAITDILGAINAEQGVTFHLSDGSAESYWAYMKSFKRGALEEGKAPEADVTICITNWDPNNNVEADFVFTPAAGT